MLQLFAPLETVEVTFVMTAKLLQDLKLMHQADDHRLKLVICRSRSFERRVPTRLDELFHERLSLSTQTFCHARGAQRQH